MRIPRIMHWVWIGPARLPDCCREWMLGWQALHPGWEFRLWLDADLFPLRNQKLFDSLQCVGARADLLRLEVILRFGGLYLDADFEPRHNIESILGERTLAITKEASGFISNGLIGAIPDEPFLSHLSQIMPVMCSRFEGTGHGQYRPTYFSWSICYAAWEKKIPLLDNTLFFPDNEFSSPPPPREMVAVHHAMRSWRAGYKAFAVAQ